MLNYSRKIVFNLNVPFDVDYVNNICAMYPNQKILLEVQNTIGISSLDIRRISGNIDIRIAGGYDKKRVELQKNTKFQNGETGEFYFTAVIYSKNEAIKIIEQIEQIEKNIHRNWGKIQKLVYIYTELKRRILYDPKYKEKLSCDIRSLRGLVTKKTVCAGYAIILKEILDRQEIECEYVEGPGHAWNIVAIEGKKYPIDLTWGSSAYRRGDFSPEKFLGQDVQSFCKSHKPYSDEITQNYEDSLSELDPKLIKRIYNQFRKTSIEINSTFLVTRENGSKFLVSQIGTNGIYFRYYYFDLDNPDQPLILFSKTNLMKVRDARIYNHNIPEGYEYAAINILFSKENIEDSQRRKTNYIGNVYEKDINSNKACLVTNPSEIKKPDDVSRKFTFPTRNFKRSDGSVFVMQQMLDTPIKVENVKIMRYDIYEYLIEDNKKVVKRNTVYTELNIFANPSQKVIDEYLSRNRLNEKSQTLGGYIGLYDSGEIDLTSHFIMPNIPDSSCVAFK